MWFPPTTFENQIFFFDAELQIPSIPQHQRISITTSSSKVLIIVCTLILIEFEHCNHDCVYLLLSRDFDRAHLIELDGDLMGAWWGLRSAQNVSRRSFEKRNYTHKLCHKLG